MDWIIKHIVNFFNLIKWLGAELFRIARDYFSAIWGVIAAILGLVVIVWDLAVRLVNLTISTLTSVDVPSVDFSMPSGVADVLALTNTVFPLDEFVNYFIAYCVIRVALLIYRLIKQWIPRVHGWGFGS